MPINGLRPRSSVSNARVVDDGVKRAGGVGLLGKGAGFGDARQVSDERVSRAGRRLDGLARPLPVARVQRDFVSRGDEQLGGPLPEAVSGTSDENASHRPVHSNNSVSLYFYTLTDILC